MEIRKIDVKQNIALLFNLDKKIADATPELLPLETPEELIKFLLQDHKSETYLLNDGEESIGFISLVDTSSESLEALNLGIDPDYKGKGLGKKLMEFAEDVAKNHKKKKVTLVTSTKNKQAIGFYKQIGYVIEKEMANYYGDGETRILFTKEINPG